MAIEVKNLSKSWGTHKVVDNVSLTMKRGEFTSLIGPNGAGKSTLLSLIGRLYPADSGEVLLDGQPISSYSDQEVAQHLSFLRQHNHVGLRLTVEELVAFGRFPYSRGRLQPEDQPFINAAIDYLGLNDIRHKFINELSGGQKQRAFIAMVLAQDTDYVLLDEPLNNLDMRYSNEIMQVLKRLSTEKGKAVVVVVHDINIASTYSDTIFALKDGALINAGGPQDIMQEPVLETIYDLHIPIHQIGNQRIGLYF